MLAGVSHDLRTPLTRMKLELAMLGESAEIAALQQDVADMELMINGYLAFARGEGTETPRPTDLIRLMNETVNGARREGMDVTLNIASEITPDFEVPLRTQAVEALHRQSAGQCPPSWRPRLGGLPLCRCGD